MNIQTPVNEVLECTERSQTVTQKTLKYIPVRPNSKEPLYKDWSSNPVDLEWFEKNPGYNVGVLLGDAGNNIVDIDLDHSIAIKLAPLLLPDTRMKFGRKSKPDSHWIYCISDAGKTKQYQYGNQGMIVEYRAGGSQTVFPSSTHESGEKIEYSVNEQPADVERKDLIKCVGKLACATLLAASWSTGSRHDCALALSGALLQSGWSAESVSHMIEAICEGAEDNEIIDRLEAVKTTEKRIDAGKSVSGWKKLEELLGEKVTYKAAEWFGIEM